MEYSLLLNTSNLQITAVQQLRNPELDLVGSKAVDLNMDVDLIRGQAVYSKSEVRITASSVRATRSQHVCAGKPQARKNYKSDHHDIE